MKQELSTTLKQYFFDCQEKLDALLNLALAEAEMTALSHNVAEWGKYHNIQGVRMCHFGNAIKDMGFKYGRCHTCPQGLKTNMPSELLSKLIKSFKLYQKKRHRKIDSSHEHKKIKAHSAESPADRTPSAFCGGIPQTEDDWKKLVSQALRYRPTPEELVRVAKYPPGPYQSSGPASKVTMTRSLL